jgi:hypothetical protein
MSSKFKLDIIRELDKWEQFLIIQYTQHPVIARFVICVGIATLSLFQHILEKYGYLQGFASYMGAIISIITKFFLPGGD